MIVQRVIKGIGGINEADVNCLLATGILCNWWRRVDPLPQAQVPSRLTSRNLEWHQNRYDDPDPAQGNARFGEYTPFISTTAGTVERDAARLRNVVHPAWQIGLEFATDGWRRSGYLFYCYLFVVGRPSIPHQPFAEEIRELNVFSTFSPFQTEGEITAKIIIPPAQIEKCEFYDISNTMAAITAGKKPKPAATVLNGGYFAPPEEIANLRDLLV